jgi:ASCH domain
MKALSVRQPWASLIASGKKTIEVRSWRTHYRGPLLICAAKQPRGLGPVGVALAVVNLVDVRHFQRGDARAACFEATTDQFAWVLGDVRRIDPIPVRGKLKMFDVALPDSVSTRTKSRPGRRNPDNCG